MLSPRLALAAVALAAAAVYAPALAGGFVWDDTALILENRYLRSWSELGANLTSDFFRKSRDDRLIGYWRPVVTLSYMVDRTLFDDRAWGFHLVNVLLHAAASCLLLLLVRRLEPEGALAFTAALLFALHPVHTESVAWISGRTDLWCGLFVTLSLWLDVASARRRSRALRTASLVAFGLALLSKEMAAVLPGLVALRALLGIAEPRPAPDRALRLAGLYGLVLVAYAAVRFGVLGIATEAPAAAAAGRGTLFLTWWGGFLEYLRVLVWPASLSVDHPVPVLRSPLSPRVLLGVAVAAGLAATAWKARRRQRVLAYGLGAMLLSFVPLTNALVPINAPSTSPFPWSERFLYVPSIGFCIAAAWLLLRALPAVAAGAAALDPRARAPRWALALVGVLACAAAARTVARTADWRDDVTLFRTAVRHAPGSSLGHLNLGVALANRGRLEEAEAEYRTALRTTTEPYKVHFNLGNLHRVRGELDRAEQEYRRSIALRPGYPQAHLNLGLVLRATGRTGEALRAFERAEELLPDFVEAKVNRGHLLRRLGRTEEADAAYRAALALEPDTPEARLGLIWIDLEGGSAQRAEAELRALVADEPGLGAARLLLALHLDRTGRAREADAQYREVLRLDPGNAAVRARLRAGAPS